MRARFPRIYETCLRYAIDLERQPAPVAPAAHYAMGGVRTDLDGRTSVPHLYAAGEAASTGVHGANRLASNSLLEAVVFGARAARAMAEDPVAQASGAGFSLPSRGPMPPAQTLDAAAIRALAWRCCGIIRDAAGLSEACGILESAAPTPDARNVHAVALLIARCALAREESRGAHYRRDFPEKRDAFARHTVIRNGQPIRLQ